MKKIIIRPQAEYDLEESSNWYEIRTEGLGHKFMKTFESQLLSIQSNPLRYPKKYKNIRIALIKGFPFVIYFMNEEDHVVVLSVYHTSRNPKKFIKRLKR